MWPLRPRISSALFLEPALHYSLPIDLSCVLSVLFPLVNMAYLGPNSQRRYIQPHTPSTTSLLSPQSRPSPRGIRAVFAQPPHPLRSVSSDSSAKESRYVSDKSIPTLQSISDMYSLDANPEAWGTDLYRPEHDDIFHNPDPRRDYRSDKGGSIFTPRGVTNLGCLIFLGLGIMALFAGYPLVTHFTKHDLSNLGGFNVGGINASGQIPAMTGYFGLIDLDTPQEVHTKADYVNNQNWQLVFSDEFNTDGRTFWPGDDPYWEALDLHYWSTNNMEWLDPTAITTRNGSLEITMTQKENHNLNYTSGMMTTWNKFCFTGGLIEVSVVLPGVNNVVGLWPAVWTMGNLGRAGYGASLEGMWPYTYDSCDVGTAPNQTKDGLPLAATENGDPANGNVLSYQPGQRLSRCSCPGSSHPGPMHEDGTFVGRAAPEIDLFEATVSSTGVGQVSQSGQWAPYNKEYQWYNTSETLIIRDTSITTINTYRGGVYQQATSCLTDTNQEAYEGTGGQSSTYGFQYQPGFDGGYIAWVANGQVAWTLKQAGMAADTVVEIGPRPIPQEPMYIIVNLGISTNFGTPDIAHLTFPTTMRVDYVRVYQDPKNINIGCNPPNFPTAAYINEYIEAYTDPNLTTWRTDYGQPFPSNSFLGQC
ncbi:hypothetical protein AcV7_009758 [Taiwanofungus camphoratus]|nr:hypothetical protein AcV7_009758 [Antrodia cinnamomea]